jgi:hypothetical protein
MTYHDTSISPERLTAPADRDGLFVMQSAARHLRADDSRLRCIDLIDNPHVSGKETPWVSVAAGLG